VPVALLVVKVGQEDACGALARHVTEVNIEGESATKIGVVAEAHSVESSHLMSWMKARLFSPISRQVS